MYLRLSDVRISSVVSALLVVLMVALFYPCTALFCSAAAVDGAGAEERGGEDQQLGGAR